MSFTGATDVTFNVTAATFTIDSDYQIRATVPVGATPGKISVTNAIGTGTSATDFTVTVIEPVVSLSPISLLFDEQEVGTPSAARP